MYARAAPTELASELLSDIGAGGWDEILIICTYNAYAS